MRSRGRTVDRAGISRGRGRDNYKNIKQKRMFKFIDRAGKGMKKAGARGPGHRTII
jgi:hypothetical protein